MKPSAKSDHLTRFEEIRPDLTKSGNTHCKTIEFKKEGDNNKVLLLVSLFRFSVIEKSVISINFGIIRTVN